jgi:serine/threonine/tyrosine-interacting protein
MTLQAPSPPHIHIPPVPDKTAVVLPASNPTVAEADIDDDETLKVLQHITGGNFEVRVRDWTYENRRSFQPILPFLYLGPFTSAKNVAALTKEGITMLLVIRDTRSAMCGFLSAKKIADNLGIQHAAVDVDGNAQLINYGFHKATRIINGHLVMKYKELQQRQSLSDDQAPTTPNACGKVLVYCESGNERSATAVTAYLMAMYEVNVVTAIQYVQTQRFCIAFDDGHKNILFNYQQILEARRGVLGAQRSSSQLVNQLPTLLSNTASKRRIDDVDRDDCDMSGMNDPDDVARFENRGSFAPFHE